METDAVCAARKAGGVEKCFRARQFGGIALGSIRTPNDLAEEFLRPRGPVRAAETLPEPRDRQRTREPGELLCARAEDLRD